MTKHPFSIILHKIRLVTHFCLFCFFFCQFLQCRCYHGNAKARGVSAIDGNCKDGPLLPAYVMLVRSSSCRSMRRLQLNPRHVTPTCPAHTSASACEKLCEISENFLLAATSLATFAHIFLKSASCL